MYAGVMTSSERRNLAWFAAAAAVTVFGLMEFATWVGGAWFGPGGWGIDLRLVLDGGSRLASGEPVYADPRFLDAPLAALIGRVMSPVDFDTLSVGFAALKVMLAATCVVVLTPRWRPQARVLALAAVACSLPFLNDVMLGNVNVLLVAAMVPAVYGRPHWYVGIPLGILVAAFPKPLVVPVLLWLLVWRPRVFAVTTASGLCAAGIAALLIGPGVYADWYTALLGAQRFAAAFAGNFGVSSLFPGLWVPVAVVTGVGLLVVLASRGPTVGLVWAVAAGILITPYAGQYAALPIALALPALVVVAPWLAFAIVALAPIAVEHPLPVYAASILIASLSVREPTPPPMPWRSRRFAWPFLSEVAAVQGSVRATGSAGTTGPDDPAAQPFAVP